ncbi:sulfotransferase [Roseibacterium sp. SDUM158016]|uniref:sulfotransferase family protein n=1 Tax=Roseicyclus sediminis TaxID=2980997 RepID=UPI0021D3313C|nr:sulfotransferase [Roseibacterium sp. SDUM158016]MCU4653105.1 sulfotransferase [Roseibacterium sp. SDUM158016]
MRADPLAPDDRPLFLVGCVRSGTTLTRDLLRRVPGLLCPEETHFLRWSEPFRTPASMPPHTRNDVLRRHREIDGVPEEVFARLLSTARSKAELQRGYVAAFARARGVAGPYHWADKTPQNIYGAALILAEFPGARLVHILRNPLNVVASMLLGRQVSVPDLHGAINYWCEAVQIAGTLQAAAPDRILHLRYEDLVSDVPGQMARLLGFAGIEVPPGLYARTDAHPERNLWREALDEEAVAVVLARCGPLAARHGYDVAACVERAGATP